MSKGGGIVQIWTNTAMAYLLLLPNAAPVWPLPAIARFVHHSGAVIIGDIAMNAPLAQKRCPRCRLIKLIKYFNRYKNTKDGLQKYCKQCQAICNAKWYKTNAKRERAKASARYKANPRKFKQRTRKWAKAHPETMSARQRRWGKANPDKIRNIQRRTRKACASRIRSYKTLQYARKKGVTVEPVDYAIVFARDHGRCHLCGKKVKRSYWHLDHLIPLSRGGEHSYRNVAVSCPMCNMRKGAGRLPSQLRLFG